jgi:hypothetical protein
VDTPDSNGTPRARVLAAGLVAKRNDMVTIVAGIAAANIP